MLSSSGDTRKTSFFRMSSGSHFPKWRLSLSENIESGIFGLLDPKSLEMSTNMTYLSGIDPKIWAKYFSMGAILTKIQFPRKKHRIDQMYQKSSIFFECPRNFSMFLEQKIYLVYVYLCF